MMSGWWASGTRALSVGALPVLAAACTPSATFELDVPSAVANEAAWYEVGVFADGCPAPSLLLGGIPDQGTIGRLAFAANAASPPALGNLPMGTYGIAAVARASDCSVIATGCGSQSVSGSGTIAVSLAAVSGTPAAACGAGTICDEASCVPNDDASLGAACSLQFVGAGPLADPLPYADAGTPLQDSPMTDAGDYVSAPAITVTPSGFVLAYREYDPTTGAGRLTTMAVDPSGASGAPIFTSLDDGCVPGSPDSTALAFQGDAGTIVLLRPTCPGGSSGGVDLFAIDGVGDVTAHAFSPQTGVYSLAQAHALAYTPVGLLLAYTDQSIDKSFAVTLAGTDIEPSSTLLSLTNLSGFTSVASASVVGTTLGTAFLAMGDITSEGGATSRSSYSLATIADAGVDASTATSPTPATWASAGGAYSRFIVASSASAAGAGSSVSWSAFDLGGASPSSIGTLGTDAGTTSFADVTMVEDHAFFAAEVGQDILLYAYEKASTLPQPLGTVDFASQPTIPLGLLRDGLIAVAASDTRVAVVWATGRGLSAGDNVGGYAVFACSQ
jgi:hypothetical protein